jgi:bifunctional non-homologous end joining protein LigD
MSGKRGLDVCVPLGARYLHNHAGITTLSPARQGLIYLDCTRNTRGQSIAAPYCVRPWARATVSTPLKWSEVRRGLDPGRFTIKTLPARLEKVGDRWASVLRPGSTWCSAWSYCPDDRHSASVILGVILAIVRGTHFFLSTRRNRP